MIEKKLIMTDEFLALKKGISSLQWSNAQFVRDYALELEDDNLQMALLFMDRAKELHPKGPLIIKKYDEYKQAIDKGMTGLREELPNSKISLGIKERNEFYNIKGMLKSKLVMFVLFPWAIFCLYQVFFATERYVSQSQVIVRKPDAQATMDTTMALLSGFGVSSGGNDSLLVVAYINSTDMLSYLDNALDLKQHYQQTNIDILSRLEGDATREEFLEYYLNHIDVIIDDMSNVITISTQSFDPEFALKLNNMIVERAEWYINSIGHQLANSQLAFIKKEHKGIESKLQVAKTELLNFQQQYGLLDPEAEGIAIQQITYALVAEISAKKSELKALQSVMSESAPQVISAKVILQALEKQMESERARLSNESKEKQLSVSQIITQSAYLKVNIELATQAYTSSLISYEKSRVEAYRQLQYLITVEASTLPEDNKYPDIYYNILLALVFGLFSFGILSILIATAKEIK